MPKVQTSLRLDAIKFKEAKEILNELGMNFTEAVNIFTNMIVAQQGLPFKVNLPNKETKQALNDIRANKNTQETTLDELEFDEKT